MPFPGQRQLLGAARNEPGLGPPTRCPAGPLSQPSKQWRMEFLSFLGRHLAITPKAACMLSTAQPGVPRRVVGPRRWGSCPSSATTSSVPGSVLCLQCVFLSPCRGHALGHFAQRHSLCAFAGAVVNQAPQRGSHRRHVRSPGPRGQSPRCRRGQGGVLPRPLSLCVDGRVLTGHPSVHVCVLIPSSCRDPSHTGSGPPR